MPAPVLGELSDGRHAPPPSIPPASAPTDAALVSLLDRALARQTDAVVGGIGRVEHAIARQTQLGIGLVGLAMMLVAAYFGIGANVRLPGVDIGVSSASAASAPDGQDADTIGTAGPENVSAE